RRALRRAQVRAGVRRPRLTIEDPAVAEIAAARHAGQRRLERLGPEDLRRQRRVNPRGLFGLARGPGLILGAQLDVAGVDRQPRRRELLRLNLERLAQPPGGPAVGVAERDLERMLAGGRVEI